MSDSNSLIGSGSMFYYQTGEEVREGDRIRYAEPFGEGFVSHVLLPHSEEAIHWGLPNGAVMLGFGLDEVVMALSSTSDEEDLEFISRGPVRRFCVCVQGSPSMLTSLHGVAWWKLFSVSQWVDLSLVICSCVFQGVFVKNHWSVLLVSVGTLLVLIMRFRMTDGEIMIRGKRIKIKDPMLCRLIDVVLTFMFYFGIFFPVFFWLENR